MATLPEAWELSDRMDNAANAATRADEPVRSYQEFLERYLPQEAKRRRREGMTAEEVGADIAREALLQAMADNHRDCDDSCTVHRLAEAASSPPAKEKP